MPLDAQLLEGKECSLYIFKASSVLTKQTALEQHKKRNSNFTSNTELSWLQMPKQSFAALLPYFFTTGFIHNLKSN
jgi:hypothetical protein